jgi:hypothetical protein
MPVENLYCIIGLKMLAETYDSINAVRYNMMMNDVVAFLRIGLDKGLWLSYDPLPLGNGNWHRVNLAGLEVYDDSISFALLGLYYCEGWSLTCQHTYAFMQNIKPRGQYPGYNPEVCWAGYINVALGFPSCSYYDGVTIGILSKIRKEHDLPSFKLAHDVAEKYADKFLDWGPVFTDYSPITPAKAMANVAWIGRMFLDYEEPVTQFTRILKGKGESVLLFPVQQMVDAVQYGEPMDLLAVVSPLKAEQVLIEPGYYLNDYLALYTFIPLRNGDKIRRQGEDYEVQTVMPFIYANHRFCIKSTVRRLIA